MSQQEKLLAKLTARPEPRDFKWSELVKLLNGYGFKEIKGKGSRRKFYHSETNTLINIHEPHPRKTLKPYQVKNIVTKLKEIGIDA